MSPSPIGTRRAAAPSAHAAVGGASGRPAAGACSAAGRVHARELIAARLLADGADVAPTSAALNARRESLDPRRADAATTGVWADDADRLASMTDAALILIDAPSNVDAAQLPDELAGLLERSAADVGLLAGPAPDWTRGEGVFVPFGGVCRTGRRSSSPPGSPPRRICRSGSSGRRRTRAWAGGMRAGCWPMRRSPSSALSASPGAAASRAERRRARRSCRAGDRRRARRLTAMAAGRHRCDQAATRAQWPLVGAPRARRAASRRSRTAREQHALHLVDSAAVTGQEQTLSLSAM